MMSIRPKIDFRASLNTFFVALLVNLILGAGVLLLFPGKDAIEANTTNFMITLLAVNAIAFALGGLSVWFVKGLDQAAAAFSALIGGAAFAVLGYALTQGTLATLERFGGPSSAVMLLLYLIEGIVIAPLVAARFAATPDGKMPDNGGFWGRLGRMLGGPAMAKYVIRRALAGVPVLLAIAFAGFVLIRAIPGGPFDYVGQKARSEQQVAALERQFGLDKPIPEQFIRYIGNIILRGDFGPSLGNNQRGQPVTEIISDGLPVSAQLGLLSVLIAFLFGIPIGVIAALNHNSPIDYTVSTFAIVGRSVPNMVLGPMFIIIFAVYLDVLPVAFWGTTTGVFWPPNDPNFDLGYYVSHAILPVLTLSSGSIAGIARLTRASVLQVLREDYIRTARAKGLPERIVIYLHALKNALIPIATIVGPFLAAAVTGSFITELIFAIPGMGDTFVQSVTNRDYNLLIGVIIIYSTFLIVGNIMVDITYTWLDPRIRLD